MEFPAVIKVDAQSKYKLCLEYNDGTSGIIDLSDIAGKGVFKWWEQDDNFFKVYIDKESGAIAWNTQLDICPDSQYLKLRQLSYEEYKVKNQSHASSI